jgi:hypothetical protein
MEKPEEECVRLWLWASDPDDIAISGTLLSEEPVVLPEEHFADGGAHLLELGMPLGAMRLGPLQTMDYDVLIHVDRVLDYSPLPDSPEHRSMDSDISGIPDDELEEEWPEKLRFVWRLGVPDRRPSPERRVLVHERLGGRGRDRSPRRGGGPGGRGYHQTPPSGRHDLPPSFFRGSSSGGGGSDNRQGCGGGRQYHNLSRGNVFDRLGGGRPCIPMGSVFDRLGSGSSVVQRRSTIAGGEVRVNSRGQVWRPKVTEQSGLSGCMGRRYAEQQRTVSSCVKVSLKGAERWTR